MSYIPFQLRRDSAANWTTNNPILREGEVGYETDDLGTATPLYKVGDGVTDWVTLPYITAGGAGDVVGPASSVAGNVAVFDDTTGKLLADGGTLGTAAFVDATTADITDSTDKRYVTDAELVVIGNTSGTNTGDQTNITGNAATVTTNANLTGHVTSVGNAAVLGSFTVADLNTALSDGDISQVQVDIFTTSGTYTKPSWAKSIYVDVQAAGGGGGSGRKGAPGTISVGGGGGASGGRSIFTFEASNITSTVAVTVGAGGTGAAAQTGNSSNGGPGTKGGASTFGSYLLSANGLPGTGGLSGAGGTGGVTSASLTSNGIGGGAASTAGLVGGVGGSSQMSGGGGGAGGGITAAGVASAGGNSGRPIAQGALAQAIGGAIATNGANGSSVAYLGAGGAGGGSSVSGTNAGNGGNGGIGSGGGGGGAGTDGVNNSGAGGNGGNGYVLVVTYG